ncbi:hypothetical protein ZHAS_00006186 [Anopheles sinensis]|uniref:Uncharacterized protein n=1 Tax=Anopheles sinensis TaxID=74873 RepID=A0A084VLD3_ANOSI|nr:hypothetical protein ZHAS_00006186 [Anopheles sinensis]
MRTNKDNRLSCAAGWWTRPRAVRPQVLLQTTASTARRRWQQSRLCGSRTSHTTRKQTETVGNGACWTPVGRLSGRLIARSEVGANKPTTKHASELQRDNLRKNIILWVSPTEAKPPTRRIASRSIGNQQVADEAKQPTIASRSIGN